MLPHYREVTVRYFAAVTQLGMRLLRLIALALELPADFFSPMFSRPMLFLRPLHYIPRPSQPDKASSFTLFPVVINFWPVTVVYILKSSLISNSWISLRTGLCMPPAARYIYDLHTAIAENLKPSKTPGKMR